jgi:putative membrane-bound dehydrogenase-like protein
MAKVMRWYGRACVLIAVLSAGCGRSGPRPPYSAKDAVSTFRIEEGYRIELFASEPDVVSPVAMDIDEDGRVWVVEDRGYPLETEKKLGRVRLLEDINGDGRADKSTVFVDSLVLPTGVMRWKQGILVTDAPHIWYLADHNGDGRSDEKTSLLEGFPLTNPQHTVNSPVYGLDNWIYIAHENPTTAIIYKDKFGDRGRDLKFSGRDVPPLTERGRNVRMRPDSGEIEALSGTSQFGHAFDAWGHHFTLNNANHARHEVIGARYVIRNPNLRLASTMHNVSDHGAAAKVFPITINPEFEMLTEAGEFTSACGLTMYLGGAMPGLENSSLVAEPVHNLVHRDVWSSAGATFVARRAAADREFLASTDAWFRPVNFYVGPDGAVYVLDYYRRAIEHPEWMSEAASKGERLYEGIDRGRIWRIVPQSRELPALKPALSRASNAELVSHLANANVWWRRTAQRLLVDRKATGETAALERVARTHTSAVGRLHALWTLEGLGVLTDELVEAALSDGEAGVRENAIRLAEPRLARSPALAAKLLTMGSDNDGHVRFQLLATLGEVGTSTARALRDRLLEGNLEDRWMQVAALSASPEEASRLFSKLSARAGQLGGSAASFLRLAAASIGAEGDRERVKQVITRAARPEMSGVRAAVLAGLAEGLQRPNRGMAPGDYGYRTLLQFAAGDEDAVRGPALALLDRNGLPDAVRSGVARNAKTRAADTRLEERHRADAIELLAIAGGAAEDAFYRSLVNAKQPEAVQMAAVRALRKVNGAEVGQFLIGNWRNLTSGVRLQAADSLYADPTRIPLVVDALKQGAIQPWTLSFRHKRQLIMHRDAAIRDVARPLLEPAPGDRAAVMARYRRALEGEADAGRGKAVYERVCGKCHRFSGQGSAVGPDLETVRNRTLSMLLEDVLLPSRAIAQGYEAYVVEIAGGETLDGVIAAQTSTSVTLRREQGKEDVIPRANIKNMYATNLSAMPEDLDKEVTPQQMADLLRYLKESR